MNQGPRQSSRRCGLTRTNRLIRSSSFACVDSAPPQEFVYSRMSLKSSLCLLRVMRDVCSLVTAALGRVFTRLSQKVVIIVTPCQCLLFSPALLSSRRNYLSGLASVICLPSPGPTMRQWPDVYCICLQYVYLFPEIWHFIATYWRALHSHERGRRGVT